MPIKICAVGFDPKRSTLPNLRILFRAGCVGWGPMRPSQKPSEKKAKTIPNIVLLRLKNCWQRAIGVSGLLWTPVEKTFLESFAKYLSQLQNQGHRVAF